MFLVEYAILPGYGHGRDSQLTQPMKMISVLFSSRLNTFGRRCVKILINSMSPLPASPRRYQIRLALVPFVSSGETRRHPFLSVISR